MKKMLLTVISIIIFITLFFLFFASDINTINRNFLSGFAIATAPEPVSFEEIKIPKSFDKVYENYNFLQIQAGFDLSAYCGKNAVRYTYKMLNFPDGGTREIYATVIVVDSAPVGGDIYCPQIDGFMLPLNYLIKD